MPRFQGSRAYRHDNPGVKGKLVPGGVVGRLIDVVLEDGTVGGQVGHVGNGFANLFFRKMTK